MSSRNTDIVTPVVIVVLIVLVFGSFGCGMMGFGGFGRMMGYGFGTMGIFGWLVMALLVIALALAIVLLVRQLERGRR